MHLSLSLFHIFIIAPFFIYVAVVRGQLTPWIFSILQILGILLLIYHSYKTVIRWKANSQFVWINIFHLVLVAPLLIFIGNTGYDTPRWAYELLAMLGFSALGYHLYSIVMDIQKMKVDDKKEGTTFTSDIK